MNLKEISTIPFPCCAPAHHTSLPARATLAKDTRVFDHSSADGVSREIYFTLPQYGPPRKPIDVSRSKKQPKSGKRLPSDHQVTQVITKSPK